MSRAIRSTEDLLRAAQDSVVRAEDRLDDAIRANGIGSDLNEPYRAALYRAHGRVTDMLARADREGLL